MGTKYQKFHWLSATTLKSTKRPNKLLTCSNKLALGTMSNESMPPDECEPAEVNLETELTSKNSAQPSYTPKTTVLSELSEISQASKYWTLTTSTFSDSLQVDTSDDS